MAKVSKSFRVDEDTLERVRARMTPGETESAAMVRILETGLDALDGVEPPSYETPDGEREPPHHAGVTDRERELYERQLDELRQQVEWLRSQCDAKDEQISKAAEQLDHAQQTTALATQSATRRRGLLGWLLGDRYNDR